MPSGKTIAYVVGIILVGVGAYFAYQHFKPKVDSAAKA